jgi:nitrous oxidase accessory protein NosD
MQVASLDELRAALRTVTPSETIELAPGEYQGPIFIDAGVTLRGLDRKTVLWRRGGPVIYVRAPGVTLSKLLSERTVTRGPLIVHKAGCAPTGSAWAN